MGSRVVHSDYNSYWIWLKDIYIYISGLKYSEKYMVLKLLMVSHSRLDRGCRCGRPFRHLVCCRKSG
jgi:hypothetical protein